MLFMLHCAIDPQNRDENLRRVREVMIGEPAGVQILGSWLSVTQLEGWVIFDAPDEASLVGLFQNWTDLNVNHVTPVMRVEDIIEVVPKPTANTD